MRAIIIEVDKHTNLIDSNNLLTWSSMNDLVQPSPLGPLQPENI